MAANASLWTRSFTRTWGLDNDEVANASTLASLSHDFFGSFLQNGTNLDIKTLDGLVSVFFQAMAIYQIAVYCVADGAFLDLPKDDTRAWFKPHVRFLAVVQPQNAWINSILFIVGSNQLNDSSRFLQAASWDTQMFRFYGLEDINGNESIREWTYQGSSADAFGPNAYLGPYNGHVNGAMIMKELRKPWYHWRSGDNEHMTRCFSDQDKTLFKSTPWLTGPGQTLFNGGLMDTAETLEGTIKSTVTNWYGTRVQNDLVDLASAGRKPKMQPSNIPRWMAHFLLTTTINIATSQTDGTSYFAPIDHFIDSELLSVYGGELLPSLEQGALQFDIEKYEQARDRLGLSLIAEVQPEDVADLPPDIDKIILKEGSLGGGKQTAEHNVTTFIKFGDFTEGIPFVILQSSYEDAQGVSAIQQIGFGKAFPDALLSDKAFNAIIMVDFCNPVYSWRRGVLFQYVPSTTSLHGREYDLESNFVSAIRRSAFIKDPQSPEHQFLQYYDSNKTASDYNQIIKGYLDAALSRLQTVDGLVEQLGLAESRRRLYRPLPLDEFGFTLPYATKISVDSPYMEMTANGSTQKIPPRGLAFLASWLGTLWGPDPKLLPDPAQRNLPAVRGSNASVETARLMHRRTELSGCPAMRNRASHRGAATQGHQMEKRTTSNLSHTDQPTWTGGVADLFSKPYWVPNPEAVGSFWIQQMRYYSPPTPEFLHIDLADPNTVQSNALTIYQHLRSKSMPVTSDPVQLWPAEALETFRLWVNQGFRRTSRDPIVNQILIPPPQDPPQNFPLAHGSYGTSKFRRSLENPIIDESTVLPPPHPPISGSLRRSVDDHTTDKPIIPPPYDPPVVVRIRKDILSLTATELQTYRARLDDILQVGRNESKWQELGLLHALWCLHYQEAFALWHRAFLRYIEELIDFPLPYWNSFANDTSDPDSPHAGIPSAFLDEKYTHPSGETRPNPLRYALSLKGKNKSGSGKYVERDPVLVEGKTNANWTTKIALFKKYHGQIRLALSQPKFSYQQRVVPWANLPLFTEDQPDEDYPDYAKSTYFDGHFEQAHDNYHGWLGPDMGDNSYTAFDPIFLSYHGNMDRIVDIYLRAKPSQMLSNNYPLQPFIDGGRSLAYSDPRMYRYTTTGDMAKDTQSIQYRYGPPVSPDAGFLDQLTTNGTDTTTNRTATSSLTAKSKRREHKEEEYPSDSDPIHGDLSAYHRELPLAIKQSTSPSSPSSHPYILFPGVTCIQHSFRIDVFVKGAHSHSPYPMGNPDFIGQLTRLGMGPVKSMTAARSCDKPAVTRMLDAGAEAGRLREAGEVEQVVTDLQTGRVVEEGEWEGWRGFKGFLVWVDE